MTYCATCRRETETMVACEPCSVRFFVEQQTRAERAEAERDLAIAHDRQPYPTADAYERVCATLAATKARLEKAVELLVEVRSSSASLAMRRTREAITAFLVELEAKP